MNVKCNMLKSFFIKHWRALLAIVSSGCSALVLFFCQLNPIISVFQHSTALFDASKVFTPWACIGGCGAGGSGNSGGATVKWIGKGVSGGLIDVQSLGGYSLFRDHSVRSLTTRFSYKPTYTSQIGLTVPVYDKAAVIQPSTLYQRQFEETGGTGDVAFDYTINFGLEGEFACMASIGLPTGQYNIARGNDQLSFLLPSLSQLGTGLTVPALTLSYSKDVENGLWVFDATYSQPMAIRLISGKNEFLDTYFKDYKDSTGNKRFYYRFKPYGENDLGDFTPPSLSGTAYYGFKGNPKIMQSVGLTFSAPLGIAWVHDEIVNGAAVRYNPRPDPDHLAWSSQIVYGVEFANPKRPLYLAIVKPVHDKKDPLGNWDPPDWESLKNEWGVGTGHQGNHVLMIGNKRKETL
jgi:hypothetical protein